MASACVLRAPVACAACWPFFAKLILTSQGAAAVCCAACAVSAVVLRSITAYAMRFGRYRAAKMTIVIPSGLTYAS